MQRAAWLVYQRSVARGLDKPLIERYFASPMGQKEIAGTYLLRLAYNCYGNFDKIPEDVRNRAKAIFDAGGAVTFACPTNPALKPLPLS